ncbi:M42 family metallopeptidase [Acetohalobium arabaticum]|uniref:Peptidase M42 family protein n=1 Tax=Acetohalobium arabaticum (strain ATCC 49924 / DSM 5501 / Z-7288) TaxID=574087 RepID=D9QQL7_ACEAZ|nr:M42 family metallopeptidase [Acetohalobium arabaticum]ADL12808.1 peptidase M42 family protein [Acetohalobium arabaticum DSM 5501]
MENRDFLEKLSGYTGVSGREEKVAEIIRGSFSDYTDEIKTDTLGNLIALKEGEDKRKDKLQIMLAAHMDEIGLMVKDIDDDGFIKFTTVGGIDQRTLVGQEVTIYGKKAIKGIIGAKPPHVQEKEERNKAVKIEDMYIDVGRDNKEVTDLVSVGDLAVIERRFSELDGNRVSGKALDDRSGVTVILECLKELQRLHHTADVYPTATVQEEVGVRGATTSTYGIVPDIGIVIDVGHGKMPGTSEEDTAKLGDGPVIVLGPQIHPKLHKKLKEIANEYEIPYQINAETTPRGTDAFAVQVTRSGIPTALISIPLRYMHTSVETLDLTDIKQAGRLLANFINQVDAEFVEGLRCF